MAYWQQRNRPEFRYAEVTRGDLHYAVNASGVINPVRSVHIGSFVSGPSEGLYIDFNDKVAKDQLMAKIDPRIYQAAVARDERPPWLPRVTYSCHSSLWSA